MRGPGRFSRCDDRRRSAVFEAGTKRRVLPAGAVVLVLTGGGAEASAPRPFRIYFCAVSSLVVGSSCAARASRLDLLGGTVSASGGTATAWLSPQYRMIASPRLMWRKVARRPPCSTCWSANKTAVEPVSACESMAPALSARGTGLLVITGTRSLLTPSAGTERYRPSARTPSGASTGQPYSASAARGLVASSASMWASFSSSNSSSISAIASVGL
jgi:hypothetical protein